MAGVVIGGATSKWGRASKPTSDVRAVKRPHAVDPAKTAPPPPADKGKRVAELLSSAPNNESLNAAEVTPESTVVLWLRCCVRKCSGGL